MRSIGIPVLVALLLAPRPAAAWWEATLQQVSAEVVLFPDGRAHVTYDLRYHVDRGLFEGLDIRDPGRPMQWDRPACYVEDARGQRFGLNILQRRRDGMILARIANNPGLRRGWVTVHLEHDEDLSECCIRSGADSRDTVSWSALTWDVGMDRTTLALRLDPAAGAVQIDDATEAELEVEHTPGGAVLTRIRPVRWYQARIGLTLPDGWLQITPTPAEAEGRPDPGTEATSRIATPIPSIEQSAVQKQASLAMIVVGLACLILLGFKWWVTGEGYPGTAGSAPALVLPRVPPLVRWTVVGACVVAGAWLQSASLLAAGTLAFAGGMLLGVRAPVRTADTAWPTTWTRTDREHLAELAARDTSGRRRLACWIDGTRPLGVFAWIVAGGATAALVWLVRTRGSSQLADTVATDAALTLAAVLLTARRRDVPPSCATGAAPLLARAAAALERLGIGPLVVATGPVAGREPERLRLTIDPPPTGVAEVRVEVERREGLGGWFQTLSGVVVGCDGRVAEVHTRSPRALARRLARRFAALGAATLVGS
jgi:hypothetical protein